VSLHILECKYQGAGASDS